MKRLLLATLLSVGLSGAAHAQGISQLMEDVAFDQKIGAQLPLDARFRDEDGRELALGELFDERPVVLAFVYYECPMLCTLVLNGLVRSLRHLELDPGRDFDIVAIGIDPDEREGLAREVRDSYVEAYGRPDTVAGWHFLTGSEAEIRRVADVAGFRYVYLEEEDEYAHASGLIVTTPGGVLSRYYYGVEYPSRDLRLGLVESSEGTLGSLIDQALLLCYQYDPLTGQYGPAVLTAMRLLGGLTVAGLVGYIVVSLRRERRAPVPVAGG